MIGIHQKVEIEGSAYGTRLQPRIACSVTAEAKDLFAEGEGCLVRMSAFAG
jgi:hypothetical protein